MNIIYETLNYTMNMFVPNKRQNYHLTKIVVT